MKGPLTCLDCAFAPDGGSLAFELMNGTGKRFSLVLDRAIDTPTYDLIFLDGKRSLSLAEEEELLGDVIEFEPTGGLQTGVPVDDISLPGDQNQQGIAECLDAPLDRLDVLGRTPANALGARVMLQRCGGKT